MAEIVTVPTVSQLEGTTREDLLQTVLRDTGLGQYGTATGGSTTTIIDTNVLQSTQYNTNDWVGGWARIAKNANSIGNAPEAEIRPITTYASTTGTITVNPAFSAAVEVNDHYELWRNPNPKFVVDMVDDILQHNLYLPTWSLLTEVADGDMEQNNTTDWTVVNATRTKETAEPVLGGYRYLAVVTTSANGYSRPPVLRVEPGKSYHVSVVGRATAASVTCKLQVWDETNGAEITSITSTRLYPVRLQLDVDIPSTCYTISIRLINVENTVTTHWKDVVMYSKEAKDIRMPWWFKKQEQLIGVFRMRPQVIASNIWDSSLVGEIDRGWDVRSSFGPGGHRLYSRYGPITDPLFIFGIRNEEVYANDTVDKKYSDHELLVACLEYQIYNHLASRPVAGQQNLKWITERRDDYQKIYKQLEYRFMSDLHRILESPTPSIYINDRFSAIRYGV